MIRRDSPVPLRWTLLVLLAAVLLSPLASAQVTLTGAMQFSTDTSGAFAFGQSWNTYAGDVTWDLWFAREPDASLPLNGPSDQQAGIDFPLLEGRSYRFYIFGAPNQGFTYNGLNLFFDGQDAVPGISVFGPTNSNLFTANSSPKTLTLDGGVVAGSGTTYYGASGAIALLTDYSWNSPATPPGSVCQPKSFTPDGSASYFGWFTLKVFPAATISAVQPGGSPFSDIPLDGSGFAPNEEVGIYADRIGSSPLRTTVAGSDGSVSATVREPQAPYGTLELFGLGFTSGRLGVARIAVTAAMLAVPATVAPESAMAASGFGFGAGEAVNVYLDNPRQLLGTATANLFGSFDGSNALQVTIPANAAAGLNALIGIGQNTGALGLGKVTVE